MHRFIYTSKAVAPLSDQQLADIAGACHRNNRRAGLSGLLVMHKGKFLHVLEGEESRIRMVCDRIQHDRRHRDFKVIEAARIDERAFSRFTVVHETPQKLPLLGGETVLPLSALLPSNSKERGAATSVRKAVRDFLASFSVLLAA